MDFLNPRILQINAATAEPLEVGQRVARTGHFKRAVAGPVAIAEFGIPGDFIGNHKHHGGVDQAIYLYSQEDAQWWGKLLQREIEPGFFGENLTISHWWPDARVGDRLHCGSLVLELTGPRTPCATLEARAGLPGLSKAFIKAERCGAYARVISPGNLSAEETLVVRPGATQHPTIAQVFRYWHGKGDDEAFLRAALNAPIAERISARLGQRLARMATN
ncbi:MAG TPA: MOSC domain-containing protein [Pseudomonas xinjiangensis]|uniref:MOSC domain-containing protein n=2 Tax=root TaxID=1 RepID=A0A7V1BM59_9GAMM|nr:MOSC domain-containing protein [Halopseudomonas xinjiangensis]HEC46407.1 MOSC domain-containing protein [Halopseudomonas xinjiangensis]